MNLDPDDERLLGLDMATLRMDLEQRGLAVFYIEKEMVAAVAAAQARLDLKRSGLSEQEPS